MKLLIMHAAVRDAVGKLCFRSLFCIECLIKQLNCYACSSAEISSIIVTNSSTLTPRYFCLMIENWLRNCTLTFTDWKCKELSSQESQTSKMLCVIYRIGAPPLHYKTSHYACSSAWYGWKVMLPFLVLYWMSHTFNINCLFNIVFHLIILFT